MYKTTVEVEGMMCKMCEAHMQDAVRKAFSVKKVSASHAKKRLEILSEAPIDEAALRMTIADTGYKPGAFACEPYEKRSFGFFRRG